VLVQSCGQTEGTRSSRDERAMAMRLI
jgi:hypothetical protein